MCKYQKTVFSFSTNEPQIDCWEQRIKNPHGCVANTLILIGLSFQVVFISSFPSLFQRSLCSIYKSNMTEISKGKKQQLNECIIMQSHSSQFIYPINKKYHQMLHGEFFQSNQMVHVKIALSFTFRIDSIGNVQKQGNSTLTEILPHL